MIYINIYNHSRCSTEFLIVTKKMEEIEGKLVFTYYFLLIIIWRMRWWRSRRLGSSVLKGGFDLWKQIDQKLSFFPIHIFGTILAYSLFYCFNFIENCQLKIVWNHFYYTYLYILCISYFKYLLIIIFCIILLHWVRCYIGWKHIVPTTSSRTIHCNFCGWMLLIHVGSNAPTQGNF